jgi:hypothetical protein
MTKRKSDIAKAATELITRLKQRDELCRKSTESEFAALDRRHADEIKRAADRYTDASERAAAIDALDEQYRKGRRFLQDALAAARIAPAIEGPQNDPNPVWVPRPPRAALALRDRKSQAFWNDKYKGLTDAQYIDVLRRGRLPLLARLPDELEFEELIVISPIRAWLDGVKSSRNTQLKRQLQRIEVPISRGPEKRAPKPIKPQLVADRNRLKREIQALQLASRKYPHTYRVDLREIVRREVPDVPADGAEALLDDVGRLSVKPSAAAVAIVAVKYKTSEDIAKRGKGEPPPRNRSIKRVITTNDLEGIERERERKHRGRPPRKGHHSH